MWYKTNILAIWILRYDKIHILRHFPNFTFVSKASKWEHDLPQVVSIYKR